MKIFVKIVICFLFCLMPLNACYAEKMPPEYYRERLNPNDNPIAYAYFEQYGKQLYNAFDATKYGWVAWGTNCSFILHKNGKISELIVDSPENNMFDKHVTKLLLKNSPKPFPPGLDEESVKIDMFVAEAHYDSIKMDYFPHNKALSMSIRKNYFGKKPTLVPTEYYGGLKIPASYVGYGLWEAEERSKLGMFKIIIILIYGLIMNLIIH